MRTWTWMLVLGLFLTTSLAVAQPRPVADLALEVEVDPTGITPPGSTGTLTLTVVNLGPEATVGEIHIASNEFLFTYEYRSVIEFFNESSCFDARLFPDPPPGGDLTVLHQFYFLDGIEPGDSFSCKARFHINPIATEPILNTWRVFLIGTDDPNRSNDEVALRFQLSEEIPALSGFGLAVFALALLANFILLNKRRRI